MLFSVIYGFILFSNETYLLIFKICANRLAPAFVK